MSLTIQFREQGGVEMDVGPVSGFPNDHLFMYIASTWYAVYINETQ